LGQKVHPIGFRLGINKTWSSQWYSKKDYKKMLHEDLKIKKFLKDKLYHAGVAKIEIERTGSKVKINIHTARPGIVIGKKGMEIENLKKSVQKFTEQEIFINIHEIRRAEIVPQLVAENIALQLQRRVSFRRAMKKAVSSALKLGALGIKVAVAGRLGGAEMARNEWHREGRVPLHTLRANIDYGFAESATTYGIIGVKVWIFLGEVYKKKASA
jgi:small subunit ribosomal protein S3